MNLLWDKDIHKETHAQARVLNNNETIIDSFGINGIKNARRVIPK
jgi:hypothetical protein